MPIKKLSISELQATQPAPVDTGRGTEAFSKSAVERFLDNATGLPEGAARLGDQAQNFLNRGLADITSPSVADFVIGDQKEIKDRPIGLPTGREILSGGDAGLGVLGGDFNVGQNFDQAMADRTALAEQNPGATQGGQLLGDGLSLLSGRARLTGRPSATRTAATTTDIIAPKLKPVFDKVLRSDTAETMARTAGRTLEGGFEGAALAIAQGGDPVESFAYNAGTQMASLGLLRVFGSIPGLSDVAKGEFIKGGAKFAGTAAAVGALIQVFKSSTPGGEDNVIQSLEAGFDKVPLALTIGALAGFAGGGRVKGGKLPFVKANLPGVIMDAFSTLPRGATISIVNDVIKDESGQSERILNHLTTSPESFSSKQIREIQKGFEEGDFVQRVQGMLENDEDFAKRMRAAPPHPRLRKVQ